MLIRLIVLICVMTILTPVSFAGTVDCRKDRVGTEDHCGKNAGLDDKFQCTTYVKQRFGWHGSIGTTLEQKKSHITSKQACIGGVAVMDVGTNYGHVGIVEADHGSTITISDRNYCCDGADRTHEISASKVVGYICQNAGQPQQGQPINTNLLNDIKQAYRDILGREADSSGLNGYYNSGLSINSIRQSLLNSNECRQGKGGECAKRYGSGSSQPSPTPQPVHLSEGNLIRLKGQNQVFVISGGKKCHIPDPETFNARGFKWDQIKEVDQNTFNSVPTGNALASVKQSVAQTPSQSQPDVNRINDIKQAYRDILGRDADAGGLNGYYNSGLSIGSIRQSLLNSNECKQGKGGECARRYASANPQPSSSPQPTRLTEGTLCRLKGQNQVYVISGGKKCYIPDPETFNARGFRWDQIKEIDQATYNSVPTGPALASVKTTVAQPPASTPSPQPQQIDTNRLNAIKQVYRDVLGREADSGGLTGYYNGGQSIGAIRQSLLNSNECHQGKGGECAKRYGSGSSQPSPTPQTVHLSEGNLIRLKGQNQVYVISGGKKCYIPDPETFNARGFNWNQIKEIDQATYNSVPTGPALASVKTTVAQPPASTPSPQPQQIDTNRLNAIKQVYRDVLGREADSGGLTGYYNGGQSIGAIRQSLLNSNECRQGKGGECARLYAVSKSQPTSSPQPNRPGEGSLIRLQGKQEVYVISGGRKCYIPDPETLFSRWRADQIKDIDQNTFNSIPTGNPLASVKQTQQSQTTTTSPQTIRVNPQIGISTKSSGFGDSNASGKQGDAFYTHGKGFSPNSSISFHVKKPDGSEFPPSDYRTNGSGEFSNTYNSHCGSPVGTYHIWVVDKATGKGSNTVTEKMGKSSKCK